eukprot:1728182-Amphidinium_carterae.1
MHLKCNRQVILAPPKLRKQVPNRAANSNGVVFGMLVVSVAVPLPLAASPSRGDRKLNFVTGR